MSGVNLIFSAFNILLVAASVMDILTHKIYDLIWVFCIILSVIVFFIRRETGVESIICMIVFVSVQEFAMKKVYGRADCHAFCSCAIFLMLYGESVEVCIFHMSVTFVLLILIQSAKKNIDRKGKLKIPVAMVPYISVGFWITAAFFMQ